MRRHLPTLRRLACCALAATVAASCAWGTLTEDEFEARHVDGVCGVAFQPDGMTPVLQALREAAGSPLRATEVTVYAAHSSFELRDPAHPEHLNDWTVYGTQVQPSEPVSVSAQDDIEARTFDLVDYPWAELPHALDKGLRQLDLESGTVVYFSIEREDPGGPVRTRAYYSGPRESGWGEFNDELEVLEARRN